MPSGQLSVRVWVHDQVPPVVGTRAKRLFEIPHDIKGWFFDRRRWVDDDNIKTRNPGYVGDLVPKTLDQLIDTQWRSGVGPGNDCKLLYLIRNANDGLWKWSPVVNHGWYYSHHEEYYLWAEHTVTHPLISNFIEGFDFTEDFIVLNDTPKMGPPIRATIFRREADYSALPYRYAYDTPAFRGSIISAGERADTLDANGYPIYANVDNFHHDEIYYHSDTGRLYFNSNFAFEVCPFTKEDVKARGVAFAAEWMDTVLATGSPLQQHYLQYFPVSPPLVSPGSDQFLYVLTWDTNSFTDWTLADNNEPFFHGPTDRIYWVDYDLGIIKFGGYKAPDTYLKESIDADDVEITVYDAVSLPRMGVVVLPSGEQALYRGIFYGGPLGDTLVQVTRGYGGTMRAAQVQNGLVQHVQQGMAPSDTHTIGVSYETTPRIEYEPVDIDTYLVADNVDVRPVMNEKGNGIVYISRRPLQLSEIVLEIDKNKIGNGLYGPVYAGTDFAVLTATGYSEEEEPVPGVPLTITETTSPWAGCLSGEAGPYTAKSNANGQVMTSFTPGADDTALGKYVDNVVAEVGGTGIYVTGDYTSTDLDEIFLFGITKDDPFRGTVGVQMDVTTYTPTSTYPEAKASIDLDVIVGYTINVGTVYGQEDFFTGGTVSVVMLDGTTYERNIVAHKFGKLYIDEKLPPAPTPDYAWVMAAGWLPWISSELNGRKKVVYQWDTSAIHPTTGNFGAYSPVNPTSVTLVGTQTKFFFPYTLPIPDAIDPTENLGGYWITSALVVTFQASGNDPLTGNPVASNLVSVRVELPDYLKGVYNGTTGQIPYGLRASDGQPGWFSTGLGGSTFLSLNPNAGTPNPWGSLIHLITI